MDVPSWTGELGWRVEGRNRALWLSPVHGVPADELTQLVRAFWQRTRPDWPLVADSDGWLSWQNIPEDPEDSEDSGNDDTAGMRRALTALARAATDHGLVLGVGGAHAGVPGLMRSVTEARLAAHVARDGGPGSVQWFDQVGARAALAWLPRARIAEVADLCLADLMGARDREALVDTVLAVLDCGGSLSQASARLGVHRNTVLSRVARAKELGLVFDDPAQPARPPRAVLLPGVTLGARQGLTAIPLQEGQIHERVSCLAGRSTICDRARLRCQEPHWAEWTRDVDSELQPD